VLLIDITCITESALNQPQLVRPEGAQHVELAVPCTYVLDLNSNLGKYRGKYRYLPEVPRCRRSEKLPLENPQHLPRCLGWASPTSRDRTHDLFFFKTVSSGKLQVDSIYIQFTEHLRANRNTCSDIYCVASVVLRSIAWNPGNHSLMGLYSRGYKGIYVTQYSNNRPLT